jgi:2-amino-4-hydroxy-6-hydroxymethyldihydropteridine diphosphokinase
LGSNQARARHLTPAALIHAAMAALDAPPLRLLAASTTIASAPVGPSLRRYANAAALIATDLGPPALLAYLKALERAFGRRDGQRWGARTIDLDIALWSGGRWRRRGLTVPHSAYRTRAFVLVPLAQIAPGWRDPAGGLTVRHHLARLNMPKPVDRIGKRH